MAFRLAADWLGPWRQRYAHSHTHTHTHTHAHTHTHCNLRGRNTKILGVHCRVEPGSVPEPWSLRSTPKPTYDKSRCVEWWSRAVFPSHCRSTRIQFWGISKKGEGHCSRDFAQLESHGVPECCCTGSPFQICPLHGLGIRPGSSVQKGAQHMPVAFCEAKAQFQTSLEAVPWRAHWLDNKMRLRPGRVPGKNAD